MKKIITVICFITVAFHLAAQVDSFPSATRWKRKFDAGLNINQASFSNNWKSGGSNSFSWTALMNASQNYYGNRYDWINDLQTIYGNVQTKDVGNRKTADRIFFNTRLSRLLSGPWRLFASGNFLSQFDAGFSYKKNTKGEDSVTRISGFMSPAYIVEACGLEYNPVKWFSAQLGVIGFRQTTVLDQTLYAPGVTTLYGVDKGEYVRNQAVFQLVMEMEKEVLKNITLRARYMGLGDYGKLEQQYLVHRFDMNIIAKVNRYINASLGLVVLYDIDQDKDIQYSQLVSVGVLYTLQNYKEK